VSCWKVSGGRWVRHQECALALGDRQVDVLEKSKVVTCSGPITGHHSLASWFSPNF
jgi:hypothetical protein